jgi:hypothetical protein
MHFQTFGPFEFTGSQPAFWKQVDAQAKQYDVDPWDLRVAAGCYLFAIKRGSALKPWYVGKTNAANGFMGEIFTGHKLRHYRRVMDDTKRKSGHILLFPIVTEGGAIRRYTSSADGVINWLEKIMIGMAFRKNPEICNVRDARLLREVWVEGVMGRQNAGRINGPAQAARNALL